MSDNPKPYNDQIAYDEHPDDGQFYRPDPAQPPLNPGSDEAIKAGCLCPRMDNSYGRGYGGGGIKDKETGETIFVRRQDCPLHGWKEEA